MFLAGHPNHQLVFMRIWQIEPTYLTTALREFYEENPMNITRILDVAQDLKVSLRGMPQLSRVSNLLIILSLPDSRFLTGRSPVHICA